MEYRTLELEVTVMTLIFNRAPQPTWPETTPPSVHDLGLSISDPGSHRVRRVR